MEQQELWLIRHAKTEENANHIMIGHTDPPLSAQGEQDAAALARHLAGLPVSALFSSSLRRARSTAETIAKSHNPPLQVYSTPLLRELHLGILDGVSVYVAHEKHKTLMEEALDPERGDYAFPDGEWRSDAVKRWESFLETHLPPFSPLPVWVVTHGAMIGLWLAQVQGLPLGAFRSWQPRHASITKVRIDRGEKGSERVAILAFNEGP